MAKLYEISFELSDFWREIETDLDNPELDINAVQEFLDNLEGDFDTKIENCVKCLRNEEAERDALEIECKRLTQRLKARNNAITRFKEYIKECMQTAKREKIKTPLFSVAVQKSPASLVLHEEHLPDKYFIMVKTPDKTAIKTALKNGEEIDGAELVSGTHLRVR